MENRKNEEIRALFVLGLLAVLASIRTQNTELTATIGQASFNLLQIIDVMILFMSFYALFMVFGYSTDMFKEALAKWFREFARLFLVLNFIFLLFVAIIFGIAYYQNRLLWLFGLVAIPVIYLYLPKLRRFLKILVTQHVSARELLRRNIVTILTITLVGCLLEIGYYSAEQFVPIYFVASAIFIIFLIYLSKKKHD